MASPTRRAVVAALATTGVAGCASLNPDSSRGETRLGAVYIGNRHAEEHAVEFQVEWEDELVYDSTHEIEARGSDDDGIPGYVPERTWPDEPGQFTVSARLSGADWKRVDPATWGYPDCLGVSADITPGGRLRLLVSQNPYECSAEATDSGRGNNRSTTGQ